MKKMLLLCLCTMVAVLGGCSFNHMSQSKDRIDGMLVTLTKEEMKEQYDGVKTEKNYEFRGLENTLHYAWLHINQEAEKSISYCVNNQDTYYDIQSKSIVQNNDQIESDKITMYASIGNKGLVSVYKVYQRKNKSIYAKKADSEMLGENKEQNYTYKLNETYEVTNGYKKGVSMDYTIKRINGVKAFTCVQYDENNQVLEKKKITKDMYDDSRKISIKIQKDCEHVTIEKELEDGVGSDYMNLLESCEYIGTKINYLDKNQMIISYDLMLKR